MHGSVHSAEDLREDLREALWSSRLFNVCETAHAKIPFGYVLKEIDRVTHAIPSTAYDTGHREFAQSLTPNRYQAPRNDWPLK